MKQKFNNQQQLKIYNSNTLKEQAKISQSLFYYSIDRTEENNYMSQYIMSYDEAQSKHNEYMTNRALDYECARLINKAMRERRNRIKKWALRQLSKHRNIYFVTFEFNEKINTRSIENKKAFVKRYLNKLECNYAYGIGVGKENGRIHFHALTTRKPKEKQTNFGYVYYQEVATIEELEKDNFCSLLLDYIGDKNFKLDIQTRNKILRTSGNLLLQKIAYIVKNTFHAGLVLDKPQRISIKDRY